MIDVESRVSRTPLNPSSVTKETYLFTFTHVLGKTSERLRVLAHPAARDRVQIKVIDKQNNLIGVTQGNLTFDVDGLTAFFADRSLNWGKYSADQPHIPLAIGATIAEIVSSETIGRWYSDTDDKLSSDARKMYGECLAADKRLKVISPSTETHHRYAVVANPSWKNTSA